MVVPLEAGEVEVLAGDLDDGGVELPAVEEEAGGGVSAKAEEGEGVGGNDGRERCLC